MADSNTFTRDADCPAHDSRCTEALCIMQAEHPKHAEYCAWRDRPMVATDEAGNVLGASRPLMPHRTIRMGGWEEHEPGTWRKVSDPMDEVWINDSRLCVQTDGTYGEGGYVEVPIAVVRMLFEREGWRCRPPQAAAQG